MIGRRRQIVAVTVAMAIAGVAATTWNATRSQGGQRRAVADDAAGSSLVTISERTLTAQQQVNGTLGFAGAATVIEPVGTAPSAVAQADQKVDAAQRALADAEDAWRVAPDEKSFADAQVSLTNARRALSDALRAASDAHNSAVAYEPTSMYTMLPAVGQVVSQGGALFAIANRPVLLLYGSVVPWRAFRAGMAPGSDVAALHKSLTDLGFGGGLAGSDAFTAASAAAIRRFQTASGLEQTGELALGAVVFQPGAVRVTTVAPKLGAPVQPGAPVLDVTSTVRQVRVQLDASQQANVDVGDPVTITLPDKQTARGTVKTIGAVAKTPPSDEARDSTASPTVDVDIVPDDRAVTGALDAAPVQVSITTDRVDRALAVPVTALLATPGGGYAVDVVSPGGVHRLAPVTLGLFDDAEGLVQITGSEVHAGQQVVNAAS
jgi:hypothetical protein